MAATFGQLMINDAIPTGYRVDGAVTKRKLSAAMTRLAKDNPQKYVDTITKVKRLGDQFATLEGTSVGLDDIAPIYKDRNAIIKPALQAVQRARTRQDRINIIEDTQNRLVDLTKKHPGTMGDQARAGARGNMNQLMKAVAATGAVNDEHDRVQPWLITHSYSEGLRPSEFWAANREARMLVNKANLEVQEPGDLSKVLINNTAHQIVTIPDCETRNGLMFPTSDTQILDRYLAKKAGTFSSKTLITPRTVSQLKKQRIKQVMVRSPMTCEADEGICQLCYGLNSLGKLNGIGENIGIRSSQALGEPLTQLTLNAKHGVRLAGGADAGISGITGFRAILESPASFRNKAVLAPNTGIVGSIDRAPQGGYFVTVGNDKVHVMQGLNVTVKKGDRVIAGDALSSGVARPDEVVAYRGLGAGREHVVNQLQKIYSDGGINVDRRHFEVLAKSTLNHMKIDDIDDKDSARHGLVRGDVINYNKFKQIFSPSDNKVPIKSAEGQILGEGVLHHLAGTRITPSIIKDLQDAGIKSVHTTMRAPEVTPIMVPATRNPLLNPDWLTRLGHRYLKQSILEGAQQGQVTNIHGANPLPGIIFGAEFGEGSQGRY